MKLCIGRLLRNSSAKGERQNRISSAQDHLLEDSAARIEAREARFNASRDLILR